MKQIKIGGAFSASEIALGCMRINKLSVKEAERLLRTAEENGINYFDHADIYGGGECERLFAQAVGMTPARRERMFIQSKCGIRKGFFDFSKEYILQSADQILSRLQTDYLDMLLLHRPDALMEPEEVAEAFDRLHTAGKVRNFGVSNQNSMQMELLSRSMRQPIAVNQLQFSITNCGMVRTGINVNMENDASINRDGSVLDYCRLKNITIQPWSPFQYGFFEGVFLDNSKFPELNKAIDQVAQQHGVGNTAVAIAWILRHPAHMQPIVGTTNAERLSDICRASQIELSREEWYAIYRAAGNVLP